MLMVLKCGEGGSLGYSLGNQALRSKQCETIRRPAGASHLLFLAVSRAAYSLTLDHVAK